MVNKVWIFLFVVGIIFSIFNQRIDLVNNEILSSPNEAVKMLIQLFGLYILWSGMLQIAKDSGLVEKLSKRIYFATKFLFPELPKGHPVHGLIATNMTANILGLGSVATPLGIKSFEEMKKLNGNKKTASRSMITLILINTSSLTLIPTTIISLRKINGSLEATQVIPIIVITTILSTISAIIIDRIFYKLNKHKFE